MVDELLCERLTNAPLDYYDTKEKMKQIKDIQITIIQFLSLARHLISRPDIRWAAIRCPNSPHRAESAMSNSSYQYGRGCGLHKRPIVAPP